MPETFTLTEAAAVIGAPVKDVNNLIDKHVLPKNTVQRRRLPKGALVSLKAVHATAGADGRPFPGRLAAAALRDVGPLSSALAPVTRRPQDGMPVDTGVPRS